MNWTAFKKAITRPVTIHISRDASYWTVRGWVFHLKFGNGAGYQWGRTFYIARNCKPATAWRDKHRKANPWKLRPITAGFTQNWNMIPNTRG